MTDRPVVLLVDPSTQNVMKDGKVVGRTMRSNYDPVLPWLHDGRSWRKCRQVEMMPINTYPLNRDCVVEYHPSDFNEFEMLVVDTYGDELVVRRRTYSHAVRPSGLVVWALHDANLSERQMDRLTRTKTT